MSIVTETQAALPTGTWREDPVHSHVGFEIGYAGGTFKGTFSPFQAKLSVDGDIASLEGQAQADSVHVLDENLTAHLLAPDFFDAERTPLLAFRTTSIRRSGDDIEASGELTIKGVSVPVQLAGTVGEPLPGPTGADRLPLKLETIVDRRKFGIDWNMELPNGQPALANEVKVSADLFLVKE
jgi:polyisoprenoid-binding protein YceI